MFYVFVSFFVFATLLGVKSEAAVLKKVNETVEDLNNKPGHLVSAREFSPYPLGMLYLKTTKVFVRGCADPTLYALYVSVTPGVAGSTRVNNLGRIDFTDGSCSGTVTELNGFQVLDRMPTSRTVISFYYLIAVERDGGESLGKVTTAVAQHLTTLETVFKQQESSIGSENLGAFYVSSPDDMERNLEVPEFERPSESDHKIVWTKGVFLISAPYFNLPQPPTCQSRDPQVCELTSFSGALKFENNGVLDWQVDYEVSEL